MLQKNSQQRLMMEALLLFAKIAQEAEKKGAISYLSTVAQFVQHSCIVPTYRL